VLIVSTALDLPRTPKSARNMREDPGELVEWTSKLKRVTASIRAGQTPPGHEIDVLLEGGFGQLISLEAKLQRDSAHRSGSPSGGATAEHRESDATETLRSIEALRKALSELQTASAEAGEQRIGYGFVLPDDQGRSDVANSQSRSLDPRSTR
jgi:hypothetical protein